MSKASKDLPLPEFEEEIEIDVLSAKFSNELDIDDFVWIENSSEGTRPDDQEDIDNIDTTSEKVAQHDVNINISEGPEEIQLFGTGGTENSGAVTAEWDKELSVEQHYWEHHGSAIEKINGSKLKFPSSQRLSTKQHNLIAAGKTIARAPSYFKLDRNTTSTLEMLIREDYVRSYHEVTGRGNNSIVIAADCAYPHKRNRFSYNGAVKIHKLSQDAKKNIAILKQTQKEYDHLLILRLRYLGAVPRVMYKKRNIIIMRFEGEDQEINPSISSLPSDRSKEMYDTIANQLDMWYNKAHLVHGKLTTKKILYRMDQYPAPGSGCKYIVRYVPTVLGWSHSVRADHPQALKKLMRDCLFVTRFFEKRNVTVKPVEKLFKEITGLDKISNEVLEVLKDKDLRQAVQLNNPNRPQSDKGLPVGYSRFK